MPTYTPNLNLEKPAAGEQYDIGVFNANADILDRVSARLPFYGTTDAAAAMSVTMPRALPAARGMGEIQKETGGRNSDTARL